MAWMRTIDHQFQVSKGSLSLLPGEDCLSLSYTGVEELPVGHHLLDVLQLQVNQHTSDLGCLLVTNNLGDKVEKHGTSLLLVVRVLLNHGGEDGVALLEELAVDGRLLLLLHLHLLLLSLLVLLHLLHLHVVAHHWVSAHVVLHATVVHVVTHVTAVTTLVLLVSVVVPWLHAALA